MPPTVNVPVGVVNSIISWGVWVGYATVTVVGLPFSSGIMSPSWSWPNVVHFQVRPARSVTCWLLPAAPAALLFAFVVTCVPFSLSFFFLPAWRCLACFSLTRLLIHLARAFGLARVFLSRVLFCV